MERIVTGADWSPDHGRENTSATLVLGPPTATGFLPRASRDQELEA